MWTAHEKLHQRRVPLATATSPRRAALSTVHLFHSGDWNLGDRRGFRGNGVSFSHEGKLQ